jgi:hypothetical protein
MLWARYRHSINMYIFSYLILTVGNLIRGYPTLGESKYPSLSDYLSRLKFNHHS